MSDTPKARETVLKELLRKYQRRFRPVYLSLVTKEEFLDIISVEQRVSSEETAAASFTEDEWTRIKAQMVECFQNLCFDPLIDANFSQPDRFKFETKCNDYVCALLWWLPPENHGVAFFEKSGAAMIREMEDYWILAFFSNDASTPKSYENEMDILGRLIEMLEKNM